MGTAAEGGGTLPAGRRPEATAAVVIGCGLTGLAVASELSRRNINPIVLNGLRQDTESVHGTAPDARTLPERAELLRLLRGYAAGHALDIRRSTPAEGLGLLSGSADPARRTGPEEPGAGEPGGGQPGSMTWTVRTRHGLLLADAVVLAGCGQTALVKLIRTLGFAAGAELRNTLRGVGLYIVGAGEAAPAAPIRELVRQAKRAGQDVADRNAALAGVPALRFRTA